MKKILFVLSNINIGGPQKSLLALLDIIDYSVFDVSILVLEPGGILQKYYNPKVKFIPTDSVLTAATIPVKNTSKHLFKLLKKRKLRMFVSSVISILKFFIFKKNMNQERQKIWKKYHKEIPNLSGEYDIAFGVMGVLPTYFIINCVKAKKKYHWVISDYKILDLNKKIEAEYFKKTDGVISVSEQCADIFVNEFPFMRGKTKVFYNRIPIKFYEKIGYNASLMPKSNEYKNILTVCRLDPLKGIEMAMEACKILVHKGVNIKWYILGDGKERANIEEMIKSNDLGNSLTLLGFQLNTLAFIQQCDIFVHPSRTEGKSIAVDEAKYAGKPIIATNYQTVGDQIENGVTGLICGMSAIDIAASIEKLLKNEELCNSLSKNCKDKLDSNHSTSEYFLALCADE